MTKAVASAKTNGAGELRKCRSRRRERIGAEVAGDGDDDEGSGERKDQRHDGVEAGLQIWSFWVGWRERSRSRSFRAIPAEEVGMQCDVTMATMDTTIAHIMNQQEDIKIKSSMKKVDLHRQDQQPTERCIDR
uniref:Retrotransposon, putative, centromere-specific n=1 Tax=Oryza sativa subsp. japonica TaxID=39947 RepID=Q6Z873_ORYSJ|nr:hypothetical protein [Oryza sativa Japonica Group]